MKTLIAMALCIALGVVAGILTKGMADRYNAGLIVGTVTQFTYWLTLLLLDDIKIKSKL